MADDQIFLPRSELGQTIDRLTRRQSTVFGVEVPGSIDQARCDTLFNARHRPAESAIERTGLHGKRMDPAQALGQQRDQARGIGPPAIVQRAGPLKGGRQQPLLPVVEAVP